MYPYESDDNGHMRDMKNIKVANEVVVRKLFNNNINSNKVNFYHGYDNGYVSTEDDNCPFGPLFKLYRFTGLSFLGRESLDDSTQTKIWLLTLEISTFLMSNLLTMYWIIVLLIDPDYESMDQSTFRRIVLPAFLLNMELISCFCRFIVNYAFDQIYRIQLFLFELVDDKEPVFRKLKKVVKDIAIIYSLFLSLSFIYASIHLYITIVNNPNLSYLNLAIKYILYVYHAFTGKFIIHIDII